MRLTEALLAFSGEEPEDAHTRESITLFRSYLATASPGSSCSLTPDNLFNFLGNWYLGRYVGAAAGSRRLPAPLDIVTSLARLVDWMAGRGNLPGDSRTCALAALSELAVTLPRAIEISRRLADYLSERRGAVAFSEFLTTFEEGGRSRYEPEAAGLPRWKEGYFTIKRIDGRRIEAQESVSEESVWPILLPEGAEGLFSPGYIVNLEIVREDEYWEIVSCGLAHPPGTPVP